MPKNNSNFDSSSSHSGYDVSQQILDYQGRLSALEERAKNCLTREEFEKGSKSLLMAVISIGLGIITITIGLVSIVK